MKTSALLMLALTSPATGHQLRGAYPNDDLSAASFSDGLWGSATEGDFWTSDTDATASSDDSWGSATCSAQQDFVNLGDGNPILAEFSQQEQAYDTLMAGADVLVGLIDPIGITGVFTTILGIGPEDPFQSLATAEITKLQHGQRCLYNSVKYAVNDLKTRILGLSLSINHIQKAQSIADTDRLGNAGNKLSGLLIDALECSKSTVPLSGKCACSVDDNPEDHRKPLTQLYRTCNGDEAIDPAGCIRTGDEFYSIKNSFAILFGGTISQQNAFDSRYVDVNSAQARDGKDQLRVSQQILTVLAALTVEARALPAAVGSWATRCQKEQGMPAATVTDRVNVLRAKLRYLFEDRAEAVVGKLVAQAGARMADRAWQETAEEFGAAQASNPYVHVTGAGQSREEYAATVPVPFARNSSATSVVFPPTNPACRCSDTKERVQCAAATTQLDPTIVGASTGPADDTRCTVAMSSGCADSSAQPLDLESNFRPGSAFHGSSLANWYQLIFFRRHWQADFEAMAAGDARGYCRRPEGSECGFRALRDHRLFGGSMMCTNYRPVNDAAHAHNKNGMGAAWSHHATVRVAVFRDTLARPTAELARALGKELECTSDGDTDSCSLGTASAPCAVSAWGEWSACSASCGTGTQTRMTSGTAACPALSEDRACNPQSCPTPAQGVVTITNVNSGKVLNVQGNSWDNGGNVQQWDNPHETSSQWRIQAVGDGVSTITNVNSAGVASADNADATDLWSGSAGVASAGNADAAGIWAGSANPQS